MKFFESIFVMSLHQISRIAKDKSMRNLVLLSIVSLLFCAVNVKASRESAKPNVILILVDDMGWMDLSCQGSDFYRTPNVDRLAKKGSLTPMAMLPARFAHPPVPQCRRAAIPTDWA
jgi:hypothetical protein